MWGLHRSTEGLDPGEDKRGEQGEIIPGRIDPGQIFPGQIFPGRIDHGQIYPGQIFPGWIDHGFFRKWRAREKVRRHII